MLFKPPQNWQTSVFPALFSASGPLGFETFEFSLSAACWWQLCSLRWLWFLVLWILSKNHTFTCEQLVLLIFFYLCLLQTTHQIHEHQECHCSLQTDISHCVEALACVGTCKAPVSHQPHTRIEDEHRFLDYDAVAFDSRDSRCQYVIRNKAHLIEHHEDVGKAPKHIQCPTYPGVKNHTAQKACPTVCSRGRHLRA